MLSVNEETLEMQVMPYLGRNVYRLEVYNSSGRTC